MRFRLYICNWHPYLLKYVCYWTLGSYSSKLKKPNFRKRAPSCVYYVLHFNVIFLFGPLFSKNWSLLVARVTRLPYFPYCRANSLFFPPYFSDNQTSVLLAGPAILPFLPLAKFNFDILVLPEGTVLHSIAFSDASRCGAKKR